MRVHGMFRNAGLVLATCATLTFVAGCSDDSKPDSSGTFFGSSQNVGNGAAKAYVTVDRDGNPTEVGIRMSEAALEGLPTTDENPPRMLMLDLPDQASKTAFDHVMFNWNSQGHEPAVLFGKPHFDIHFYMSEMGTVQQIDPGAPDFTTRAALVPESKYVPQDYVTPPGPPPAEQTVPFMGLHWVDSTAGMIPGVYDFTQTFINGSWNGDYIFMEPMMTATGC